MVPSNGCRRLPKEFLALKSLSVTLYHFCQLGKLQWEKLQVFLEGLWDERESGCLQNGTHRGEELLPTQDSLELSRPACPYLWSFQLEA